MHSDYRWGSEAQHYSDFTAVIRLRTQTPKSPFTAVPSTCSVRELHPTYYFLYGFFIRDILEAMPLSLKVALMVEKTGSQWPNSDDCRWS